MLACGVVGILRVSNTHTKRMTPHPLAQPYLLLDPRTWFMDAAWLGRPHISTFFTLTLHPRAPSCGASVL